MSLIYYIYELKSYSPDVHQINPKCSEIQETRFSASLDVC